MGKSEGFCLPKKRTILGARWKHSLVATITKKKKKTDDEFISSGISSNPLGQNKTFWNPDDEPMRSKH